MLRTVWKHHGIQTVNTYLSFLLVKIVNDHTDEKVEGKKRAEYDEDNKVEVHVEVNFSAGLFLHLKTNFYQLVDCYKPLLLMNQVKDEPYLLLLNQQLHSLFPSIL